MAVEERYHGLDFLRALMMLLGLVLHTAQYYMDFPVSPIKYKALETHALMDLLVISINGFRMPAFFALSGFFLALLVTRQGRGATVSNRMARIVWPFLLFLPITMVVLGLLDLIAANLMYGGKWGLDPAHLPFGYKQFLQTQHLWFLYYLVMFYLVAWGMATALPESMRAAIGGRLLVAYRRLNARVWGMCVTGCLVGLIGLGLETGRVNGSVLFDVEPRAFFYFGVFFGLGWLVYRAGTMKADFEARCWLLMLLACTAMYGGIILWALGGMIPEPLLPIQKLALACLNGMAAWLFTGAFWGLALRYYRNYSPLIRYATDSAYWIYLVHLPIITLLALGVHFIGAPALVKFGFVFLTGTFFCWASYALIVRKTPIGRFLNGRIFETRLPQKV